MSKQHKQGRPQGGHGEGNSRSAAGSNYGDVGNTRFGRENDHHGGGYGSQDPWRGEGQGQPPRDGDEEARSSRHPDREYGNYGRQDYGNYGPFEGNSQRRSQGEESGPDSRHRHEFDPDYLQWRREQMQRLDDDYRSWRQDRFKKFSDEFSSWRKQRSSSGPEPAGGSGDTSPTGTSTGSSLADSASSTNTNDNQPMSR
jgi:hypothetical protein